METGSTSRDLLRKKSFAVPVVNPFVHDIKLSFPQKIQVFFMSITIAPIRFILFMLCMLIAWAIAFISTIGIAKEPERPARLLRTVIFQVIACIGRLMYFVMGFHIVEIIGKRAKSEETRLLVAAPHTSHLDTLLWFCTYPLPSAVSRVENAEAPIFGSLTKTLQPVLVSRHDPQSRQNTIKEIKRRACSSDDWPQIIIFPEGTTTNGKSLITFKAGAFIPGVPVQPVLLKYQYPNGLDTLTWTMNGPGAFTLLWLTLCQFSIRVQIEFLPVYHPSEEEVGNPKIYAENVRQLMADALEIPCTDHTFEDCRLMNRAESRNLPMESGLVEFSKLNRKLGIDLDEMQFLLDEFAAISGSCKDGLIGIEEFAEHLNLPVSGPLQTLFDLYDRDGSGMIDFREYVIGLSLVSHAAVTEKTMKLAFKVFDRDGDGFVSREELDHALKSVFGSDMDTRQIYDKIDIEGKNTIDYEQFYAFVKKRPEYAKLFVSYAELEEDFIPVAKPSARLRSNSIIMHMQRSTADVTETKSADEIKLEREKNE